MQIKVSKVGKYALAAFIVVMLYLFYTGGIESDFRDLQKNLTSLRDRSLLLLDPAPRSHYGDRDGPVKMIIVHHTVIPTLKVTKDALNTRGLSVHFVVDRDGSITLMVPLEKAAWHAGISYAKIHVGDTVEELCKLNAYSIGIEIINTGLEPFSEAQMSSVKDLILYLMKRFNIRKDLVFSHAEIGTIVYDSALEDYVLRKPDPHKLFDWEFLAENGVGVHIGDRISPEDTKKEIDEVLYKIGDKNENILQLKLRLNRFFYKILPWSDKRGDVIFPDNETDYSDQFDENFAWVVYQFSMHHLPSEIRKDLPLKLEQEDIFPIFLSQYGGNIANHFANFSNEIKSSLKSPYLDERDYQHLLSYLAQYENVISASALSTLMYKIGVYYDSYLRVEVSALYQSFSANALKKLDILKDEVLSLKSLDHSKVVEVTNLIDNCRANISSEFQNFEKQWFHKFKETWQQKFIPSLYGVTKWTRLHEVVLKYLETAR